MPFCTYYNSYFREVGGPYIRFFHAAPSTQAVDVYANDALIALNLRFKNFTQYMRMLPGRYRIKVFIRGTKNNPLINTEVNISERKIVTVAVVGILPNITLKTIEDTVEPLRPGRTKVKFVHLSPDAPAVDVTMPDGKVIFGNVPYEGVTKYIQISPGTYNLQVRAAGTDTKVLLLPNTRFRPNKFYTIYAVGLVKGNPPLQAVMPLDGNTYLKV